MEEYNRKRVLVITAIVLIASVVACFLLWRLIVKSYEDTTPFEYRGAVVQPDPNLVERATAYIVAVTTNDGYGGAGFFTYNPENKTEWYVVTNEHIVGDDESVSVYWPEANQQIDNVPVLYIDNISDVAILNLQPRMFRISGQVDGLEYIKNVGAGIYTSSERPSPGTPIFTFGFPNSAQGELTKTIGTVKSRRASEYCGNQPIVNWLAIGNETSRPGFSGGPVLTYEGAIVGMNSCGPEDEYSGLATPMEEIRSRIKAINNRR